MLRREYQTCADSWREGKPFVNWGKGVEFESCTAHAQSHWIWILILSRVMIKTSDFRKSSPMAPHPVLPAYYADPADRERFVRELFDQIAPHYDRINRLFSLGTGDWYRRRCLLRAGLRPGMRVLDAAIGTGPIARQALAIQGKDADVIGLDVSEGMLRVASRELGLPLVLGRMEQLPIAGDSIDVFTIGYALRHVADLGALFHEVCRVLRPRGVLLALEIGLPSRRIYRSLLGFYLGWAVPRLSRLGSRGGGAQLLMQYYWETILYCVPEQTILKAMTDAGLVKARCTKEFGLFRSYSGLKS